MNTWTSEELDRIGDAEELQISSIRIDGIFSKPVTIWVVRVANDLYVRSVKGRISGWFRGTQVRHEGRINAGGVEKDVTFLDITNTEMNDKVDAAYLTKYRRYPQYVAPMVTPDVKQTTIKLIPRS
jgi:hypothetical protein